jgi:hypothetical protein
MKFASSGALCRLSLQSHESALKTQQKCSESVDLGKKSTDSGNTPE